MSGSLWVVDYDIPTEPKAKRMAFYRALWALLEEHKIVRTTSKSTMSVWILDSQEIATQIHELAARFGVSHLYQASEVS